MSLGVTLFLMICCIKHWYHSIGLSLPFHSCIFDNATITASGFKIVPCLWKNGTTYKLKLCKQHKILCQLLRTVFVLKLQYFFFTKRSDFYQNCLFDKRSYNWKTNAVVYKRNRRFLDIIMLMLLGKFALWCMVNFFHKINYQKVY